MNKRVYYVSFAGGYKDMASIDELFREKFGKNARQVIGEDCVLILDEAQNIYHVEGFWGLMKGGVKNCALVCFSVYDAKRRMGMAPSPVVLQTRLGLDFLRFSKDQCNELVQKLSSLHPERPWDKLSAEVIDCVFVLTGAVPGLLYHALLAVTYELIHGRDPLRTLLTNPSWLLDALQTHRCFVRFADIGEILRNEDMRCLLLDLMVGNCKDAVFDSPNALILLNHGLISRQYHKKCPFFSCPLTYMFHRREYYGFYRLSAAPPDNATGSLEGFICLALERFSAADLKQTRSRGASDAIYERFYQMAFARSAYSLLPDTNRCDPDVGRYFQSTGNTIDKE
jgi:hypothetical protein